MELQTTAKKSKRKRNKKAKKNVKKKASKKGKYANYVSAPSNGRYFLFDVETTGSKRNWDRIIFMLDHQTVVRWTRWWSQGVTPRSLC